MNKYFQYFRYILKHKYFVFIEACKLGIPWRGFMHDMSKLLPSEFLAYTEKFYGGRISTEYFDIVAKYGCPEMAPWGVTIEDKFTIAWLKHQHRNKHHWEYWVFNPDKNDGGSRYSVGMPKKYLKEMLADWRGAGKAITGKDDTKEWYLKNKTNIVLRNEDRQWIEQQLLISPTP